MGSNLYSLERSLKARRKRKDAKTTTEGASAAYPISHAKNAQAYDELQTRIEVVRGQRLGVPTSGLMALEDRLLGRCPANGRSVQRHVQRLDQGQLTQLPPQQPTAGNPLPNAPMVAAQSWQHSNSFSDIPASYPYQANQHQYPSSDNYQQAASSYPLSPEFSAPDTTRFNVESFGDPASPDSLFRADPALVAAPAIAAPTQDERPQQTFLTAPATPISGAIISADNNDWLAAAQSEQPNKITASSKKALNTEAALAKDEFERELAAILGHSPSTPSASQEPPFDPSRAPPPTPLSNAASKPDPEESRHMDHSVFDRMGLGMQYANSFDLGKVSLSERFDRFEQDLAHSTAQSVTPPPASSIFANPFVEAASLDDFDLMAELAEISTERPAAARKASDDESLFPNNSLTSHSPQLNSPGENHEQ